MTRYIPATRVHNMRKFQRLTIPKGKMVLIEFRFVPFFSLFRWQKQWWKKTHIFRATNETSLRVEEMPPFVQVGVFLQSLDSHAKQRVVKKK
jgi:hypothetical protein